MILCGIQPRSGVMSIRNHASGHPPTDDTLKTCVDHHPGSPGRTCMLRPDPAGPAIPARPRTAPWASCSTTRGRAARCTSSTSRPGRAGRCPGRRGCPPRSPAPSPARGIRAPWSHQAHAADHAQAGRNVIISTAAASGKSLGYLLPALTAVLAGDTVLYVTPTKALAADQLAAIRALGLPGVQAATCDGDSTCGRAGLGPQPRQVPADHAGHAAPRAAARARPLVGVLQPAALRGDRRMPRVPRASSAPTWATCCGGCAGWWRITPRRTACRARCSCSPRPRSGRLASAPGC